MIGEDVQEINPVFCTRTRTLGPTRSGAGCRFRPASSFRDTAAVGWGGRGRGAAHIRAWWRVLPSSSISSISSCPPPGCIAEPSRGASGGEPSSMGGVSFCSRSPPSGIAAPSRAEPSRVARGGGPAGEGGGASGDDDDVAIAPPPRPLCERNWLPSLFTPVPPLASVSTFDRVGPVLVSSLLGFVQPSCKGIK